MDPARGRCATIPSIETLPSRLAALQTIQKNDAKASGAPKALVNIRPNDFSTITRHLANTTEAYLLLQPSRVQVASDAASPPFLKLHKLIPTNNPNREL